MNPVLQKALLLCGAFSSVLYVGTDILAGIVWEGYSFFHQAVSELSAVGAPTRALVVPLYFVCEVLTIGFGLGVWGYSRRRVLRIISCLMVGIGVLGFVGAPFPLQLGVAEADFTNTMHSLIAGLTGFLYLVAMLFGIFARGKWFRLYSIGTLLTLVGVGGTMAFMAGTKITEEGFTVPPQWFGFLERLDIYGSMLWVAVLAIVLLRGERESSLVSNRDA